MARRLKELRLARKIALIASALAAAGVLAAGAVYTVLESTVAARAAQARLTAEIRAAAQNLARFPSDRAVVERALAMLRSDSDIRSAELRDARGRPIATGRAPQRPRPASPDDPTSWLSRLTAGTFDVPVPGADARTLHVEADFSPEIGPVLKTGRAFVLILSAIAAALVAVLLRFLGRRVRKPVVDMVAKLHAANGSADFSQRLEKLHDDEFGALTEEINTLLDKLEGSDRSLRAYTTEFERRVLERTRQLDAAVEEARDATRRAEEASRARGDFLAHMSHEIRTPLNGVLGMAELLQHSPRLDERQRRYAMVIHQSGEALLKLINDVLDFSKIEAGKLELAKERFCVREMVEDALEILAERAQSKGLELICDVPVDIDTVVFADCLRLRQVVLNLISNAVKFTEQGDITLSVRSETGIEHSVFTFAVTDTGIGIEAAACATIFDAFVQADSFTSRRYGGTGLGLAISRQLVELMGGTISVRSTPGSGSTFEFSVPLAVDRTARREKPAAILATTRVLIAEKSPAARRMLRQHLKSWGAITTELGTAGEMLRRLRGGFSGEFELLILDAQLPDGAVAGTVAAVRKIEAFAELPILVMYTGSGDPPPEARGMQGPVAWQNKPIRRSQLQRTLERLLGKETHAPAESPGGPAATRAAAAGASSPSRLRRVLLVEDNAVNREVARAMLQSLEVEIDTAGSGIEALEKLTAANYDAVLMDCQIPGPDGYETTRRYREWETLNGRTRTPVVALTANALGGDAERCRAAGMDHYVSKPFTLEQLHAVLEACAQAAGASGEAGPPAPLDAKTLERLRTLSAGGRADLLARLADIYEGSSTDLVNNLLAAARANDIAGVGRAAHALKSSSANVGATVLAATCRELESAAHGGDSERVQELMRRLEPEHHEVLGALRAARKPAARPADSAATVAATAETQRRA